MTSREYAYGDLTAMLRREQELWHDDSSTVACTFGQVAFWSARLLDDDWTARLRHERNSLVGWGWLAGGTELAWEVRPTHRTLLDKILDWGPPARSTFHRTTTMRSSDWAREVSSTFRTRLGSGGTFVPWTRSRSHIFPTAID
jgi:hypothetical protein